MEYLCILHLVVSMLFAFVTRPAQAMNNAPASRFVSIDQKSLTFMVNGQKLDFIGTNAYWLPTLNSEADIDFVLANMAAKGVKVVRTWAFNDVHDIPENGTWFQLIANGTTTINTGPNGLQKLDTVIRLAEKHGIFVVLSLTNNWNAVTVNRSPGSRRPIDVRTAITRATTHVRNTLSNDYGGMDAYVKEFGTRPDHDEFYTNPTIRTHFLNYTSFIVSRYKNNSAIFSWEIANDPRCGSSLPASPSCNTTTVTKFHATVSTHIKTTDPNHLISSGNQGFICTNCTKIIPKPPPNAPPIKLPQPLPVPVSTTESIANPDSTAFPTPTSMPNSTTSTTSNSTAPGDTTSASSSTFQPSSTDQSTPLPPSPPSPARPSSSPNPASMGPRMRSIAKAKRILRQLDAQRKAIFVKIRKYQLKMGNTSGFIRIRGRWMAPPTSQKRQSGESSQIAGSAFDGSQGVDSQDILNIPDISFGSFQLFPDQNSYGPDDPTLPAFNNTINQGLAWIRQHAAFGMLVNKPVTLNGFGLVTQSNAAFFVPFNATDLTNSTLGGNLTSFLTDEQRDEAYTLWLRTGLEEGLQGMFQYQWSQGNLSAVLGTPISPNTDTMGNIEGTGVSPNDGYGQVAGDSGVQDVIDQASQAASSQP